MLSLRINKYLLSGLSIWIILFVSATYKLEDWGWLYCVLIPLLFVIGIFSDLQLSRYKTEIQLAIFRIPYARLPLADIISVEKYTVGRLLLHPWDMFNFYTAIGWTTPFGLLATRGTIYLFRTRKGPNVTFCPLHITKIMKALEKETTIKTGQKTGQAKENGSENGSGKAENGSGKESCCFCDGLIVTNQINTGFDSNVTK